MKNTFISGLLGRKTAPMAPLGDGTAAEIAALPFGTATFGAFLAGLNPANPAEALERIVQGFAILERPTLAGDLRVRLLLALDDRARECVAALERGLFIHVAAETASESVRLALLAYFERFGTAALATLAPAPGRGTLVIDRARILLLINRGLLAFYGRQKMLALGQRDIPATFWSEVLRLRRLAVAQGIDRNHCMPYSQVPLTCSTAQLIALLMAFNAAPRHLLRPNEMQALDQLLRHWFEGNILDISDAPGADQTVYFFGAGMRAPFRALPAMYLPGDGVLYTSLDEAHARACELDRHLRETGSLPPPLADAGPALAWQPMLEALASHWQPAVPARQSERRVHVGEMLVAPGFEAATRLIALSAQARSALSPEAGAGPAAGPPGGTSALDYAFPEQGAAAPTSLDTKRRSETLRALQQLEEQARLPGIVKWQFLDHSATGFAVLLTSQADWAHPGRVVTYRREIGSIWRMAVIRRRTHVANGDIVIGLEKLPAGPQLARIMALTRENWGAWRHLQIGAPDAAPAIFFGSRPPLLLIERARFCEGHRHLLVVGGERHLIDLKVRTERDPDFVVARVDFMSAPLAESAPEFEPVASGELMITADLAQMPQLLNH